MYGGTTSLADNRTNTNDSTIKVAVDTWYENNLLTSYDKYISKSAIYCNDRSVPNNDYSSSGNFYYGASTRLGTNKAPSYKCGANASNGLFETTQAIADKFSVSTTGGGNGQLKYPVALITADEIVFAGGSSAAGEHFSSPYIWYSINSEGKSIVGNKDWMTMSPYGYTDSSIKLYGFVNDFEDEAQLYEYFTAFSVYTQGSVVRPAISLSSCVRIKSGNGTPTDPYVVDENSCS